MKKLEVQQLITDYRDAVSGRSYQQVAAINQLMTRYTQSKHGGRYKLICACACVCACVHSLVRAGVIKLNTVYKAPWALMPRDIPQTIGWEFSRLGDFNNMHRHIVLSPMRYTCGISSLATVTQPQFCTPFPWLCCASRLRAVTESHVGHSKKYTSVGTGLRKILIIHCMTTVYYYSGREIPNSVYPTSAH